MFRTPKTALTFAFAILCATTAQGAQVELRSEDGLVSIDGEILGFDGDMLTVDTGYGVVKIPGNSITCLGDGCPDGLRKGTVKVSVAYARPEDRALFDEILRKGAEDTDLGVSFNGSGEISISGRSAGASLTLFESRTAGDVRILSGVAAVPGAGELAGRADWASRDRAAVQLFQSRALAVVIGSRAGVASLSMEDLARVFAGEVTNWSELGGNDVDVQPMQTAPGDPTHDALRRAVTDPFGKQVSKQVLIAKDIALVLSTLAVAPGGIAVVPVGLLGEQQPVAILDACGRPSRPDQFSVANGSYPLIVSTYAEISKAVASAPLSATMDRLALDWSGSELFESDLARLARLDVILKEALPEGLKRAAEAFVASTISANRMAITLRDGPLPRADAARQRLGFVRLAKGIANGDFDGREIMFLGFTEGPSDPAEAIARSTETAEAMLKAFRDFAPDAASRTAVSFVAAGHGFVGQSNCAATDAAQPFVEIWVRAAD